MKPIHSLCLALCAMTAPLASSANGGIIDVHVVPDRGVESPRYRAYPAGCRTGEYYYVEAARGERYSIRVSNRSNRRIGVVIAVDGRNIISGMRSYLRNTEPMYLIDPWETQTFEGWRTGMARTNRFFFTDASSSYAQKVFADGSAMGTIAVAAFYEKQVTPVTPPFRRHKGEADDRSLSEGSSSKRSEQAGTGFGETTYSPAYEVPFEPESREAARVVLKYEWRDELCRKGIAHCEPANRFWPVSDGFAPIPHDFRER